MDKNDVCIPLNGGNDEVNKKESEKHEDYENDAIQEEKSQIESDHLLNEKIEKPKLLTFNVKDNPPVYISIIYVVQMVLSNMMGSLGVCHVLRKAVCAANDDMFFSRLVCSSIFMSGLSTFLQVSFGIRLPIFQGSSSQFLAPALFLMQSDEWNCNAGPSNTTIVNASIQNYTNPEPKQWREPVLELSGSLAVASLLQIILGTTGAIGFFVRFVGPLTVVPVIATIGFFVIDVVIVPSMQCWWITFLTAAVIMLCALVINHWMIPFPSYTKSDGFIFTRYPLFKIFANLWGMTVAWLVALVLTAAGAFTDNPEELGYFARTDVRLNNLYEIQWFNIPYPGQWGMPTFNVSVFVGMLVATMGSVIESVGDYIATAHVCQVPPPPVHAINRAVTMEGIASVISGLVGTLHGTTSYSSVMGFIVYTGVSSRILWQIMGFALMILGIFGKFGAFAILMPEPIVGGLMLVSIGSLIGVALSNLEKVEMQSARNQLVLGVSMLTALCMPRYIKLLNKAEISGVTVLDQILTMFLSSAPFVGGVVGCSLDNILPGSRRSRGFFDPEEQYRRQQKLIWKDASNENIDDALTIYYPIRPITKIIDKFSFLQQLPFFPKIKSDNW